jgi:hypothetical protein
MAKLKLGPVVVGLRGTVGGLTFSANKSGPYVKQWQRPPKVRTNLQTDAGNTMLQASSEWVNITALQRADWDTWAAGPAPARFNSLGEPLVLSGFNWFVEMNSQLLYNGASINQPAPVLPEPGSFPLGSLFMQAVPIPLARISHTVDPIVGFFTMYRMAQGKSNASNSFAQPNYYTFRRGDGATNPSFILPDVVSRWGTVQENRAWYLQAHLINLEGLRGPATLDLETT